MLLCGASDKSAVDDESEAPWHQSASGSCQPPAAWLPMVAV